jgi:hypothetical protein
MICQATDRRERRIPHDFSGKSPTDYLFSLTLGEEALCCGFAERVDTTIETMLAEGLLTATLLKRLPTLAELADFAAFVAPDRAIAMTGAIANLTCGSLGD